jgi:PAS domain S-box-containing protein
MVLYLEVINEWKKREIALKEGEERFRRLVEMAPDAIFLSAERKLIYANTAAARLLRVGSTAELIGQSIFAWLHPDYRERVDARHSILSEERRAVPTMEQVYVRPDGSLIDVEVSAVPIRFNDQDCSLAYVRDISARKQQEQEKLSALMAHRQQQKLESIGTLASGVAHEINNPIMGIINYAQLILDDHPSGDIADYAQAILLEGNRISGITNDLLFYSRQQKQSHSPAKIEDIVNRTLSLVSHLFKKDLIDLVVEIEPGLPEVKCRSQQIQQILMNLLTNARDALNERFPGRNPDKIAIVRVSQFEEYGQPWIRLTVEDHGPGIPETVSEQLFDPFFTTKSRDLGTGLGLPISYGIAQDHHGRLHFESEAGRTCFYLELPVDNGWNI